MEQLPSKAAGDAAYEVGRAIVSVAPGVGGPLQVLYENVFTAPLDRRRQDWLERLAGVVEELESRVDGLEARMLGDNDAFVTTAIQASQIAVRNHSAVKLDALRNAVLNAGLPGSPSDDEQAIFMRLVDELTPWHLRILVFLRDPRKWVEDHGVSMPDYSMGATSTVLEACFPELKDRRDFYDQLVKDLVNSGLAPEGSYMHASMTESGMYASRTTAMGVRFLAFITAPSDA